MDAAFVPLSPRWPDPACRREPSQSWQLPPYRTCGASSNRRSVEKRSKRSPRLVFFPLDPKKRHLQWATWWVFRSSERPPGGLSEDPKKRHQKLRKPGELRLCRSQASRAGMFLQDAGKSRVQEVSCLLYVITDSRLGVHPNFPPLCTSHRV